MAAVNSDFVDVQLSPAGVAAAGKSGALRITVGRMSYAFVGIAPVKVLTSEWSKILARRQLGGKFIFQLVPAVAAGAAPGTPAKVQLKNLQAQEVTLQTEIAKEGK